MGHRLVQANQRRLLMTRDRVVHSPADTSRGEPGADFVAVIDLDDRQVIHRRGTRLHRHWSAAPRQHLAVGRHRRRAAGITGVEPR